MAFCVPPHQSLEKLALLLCRTRGGTWLWTSGVINWPNEGEFSPNSIISSTQFDLYLTKKPKGYTSAVWVPPSAWVDHRSPKRSTFFTYKISYSKPLSLLIWPRNVLGNGSHLFSLIGFAYVSLLSCEDHVDAHELDTWQCLGVKITWVFYSLYH